MTPGSWGHDTRWDCMLQIKSVTRSVTAETDGYSFSCHLWKPSNDKGHIAICRPSAPRAMKDQVLSSKKVLDSTHHWSTTKTTYDVPATTLPNLDTVGVCRTPDHQLLQLRTLKAFEAATEVLQLPGFLGTWTWILDFVDLYKGL